MTNYSYQKGVSLIITFFIMTIVLAVILAISAILYSELKIIRNMGDSVVAFFAADSGSEKVLYYDRKVIPSGAARGICNICDAPGTDYLSCSADSTDAATCAQCTDCEVTFTTIINQASPSEKSYDVVAVVFPGPPVPLGQCGTSMAYLQSRGIYKNTKRAINLDIETEVKTGLGPGMDGSGTTFTTVGQNEQIKVSVSSTDPITDVIAYIYYSATGASGTYTLVDQGALSWVPGHDAWEKTFLEHDIGYYYVSIGAIDANGFCASVTVIPTSL